MNPGEQRTTLTLSGRPSGGGDFEILGITAGEGNGWVFSAAVLKESLRLWEGVECFIDHALSGRSLRDLAGVCYAPQWNEAAAGVQLALKPGGPSAGLLRELGRQMLEEPAPSPRVGFSADIAFTAHDHEVARIVKIHSLDLVFNPARGGAFLRALNSTAEIDAQSARCQTLIDKEKTGMTNNQTTHEPNLQELPAEPGAEQALRQQMCAYLLDTALTAAHLPVPAAERVRKQFGGRIFDPAELNSAIEDSRALVSELTGALVVQGPGRISGMVSGEDQLTAAVHDLLGAQRPQGLEGVRPARLTGIRELYTGLTGDDAFNGGYYPERAQFASSTASLPGLLKNAMNKLIVARWEELGRSGYRWWENVVSVQHFNSLQPITGVLVGEVTLLPGVEEGAAYTELDVTDSPETGSWSKFGAYVGLTLEMFERDETHRLRLYPQKLASAGLRRISNLVGSVFTANAGVGPTMRDGYAVFESDHHNNLGSEALSAAAWEAASTKIYNQPMLQAGGSGPKQALDAKYLLVPRGLRLTAMQILYPDMEHTLNVFSENLQKGAPGDVITVPEFNDPTDWAAAADPYLAPAVILGERFGVMPEIVVADGEANGALFTNDQIRIKARHFVSVFVADHRPLFKANVAG